MPFQSKTVWAEGIVPAFSPIRQKLSERMVTDIAGHLITTKKDRQNPKEKMGNQL
jgi:hypothetical protein